MNTNRLAIVLRHPTFLFFAPVTIVLLAWFLLRLFVSPNLHQDDADIVFFNQSWAWGYGDQGPLYSWLFHIWSLIFGANLVALTLFRTVIIAGVMILAYVLARKMLPNEGVARWAAWSVLLLPTVTWHAFHHWTHSLLLALVFLAFVVAVLRLAEYGRFVDYLIAGVIAGLGVATKYNFAFMACAMVLAGVTIPETRRRLATWRMGVSVVAAFVVSGPHLLWMLSNWDALESVLLPKFESLQSGTRLNGPFGGLFDLAKNYLVLGGVALGLFWLIVGIRLQASRLNDRDESSSKHDCWRARLLFRSLLAAAVLFSIYVVVSNAERFRQRWIEPFFLIVPVLLFLHFAVKKIPLRAKQWLAAYLVCVVTLMLVFHLGQKWRDSNASDRNFLDVAFTQTVQDIPTDREVMVVSDDSGILGNFLVHRPNWRGSAIYHAAYQPTAAKGRRRYLLLWNKHSDFENLPEPLRKHAEDMSGRKLQCRGPIHTLVLPSRTTGRPALELQWTWAEE